MFGSVWTHNHNMLFECEHECVVYARNQCRLPVCNSIITRNNFIFFAVPNRYWHDVSKHASYRCLYLVRVELQTGLGCPTSTPQISTIMRQPEISFVHDSSPPL